MHALSRKSVQVDRKGSRQRLTFTGAHFGDLAVVQNHTADKLHVEVTHPQHAATGFAYDRECFGQQRVKRFALVQAFAEFSSLAAKLLVGKRLNFRFKLIDLSAAFAVLTNQAVVATAENLGKKRIKHISTD